MSTTRALGFQACPAGGCAQASVTVIWPCDHDTFCCRRSGIAFWTSHPIYTHPSRTARSRRSAPRRPPHDHPRLSRERGGVPARDSTQSGPLVLAALFRFHDPFRFYCRRKSDGGRKRVALLGLRLNISVLAHPGRNTAGLTVQMSVTYLTTKTGTNISALRGFAYTAPYS